MSNLSKKGMMKNILYLILTFYTLTGNGYADIAWSAPTQISTSLTDASDPRIVIDKSGNSTAAWIEKNVIMSSSKPNNGKWSSPTAISNPLNTSSSPKLAVDGSGNVTAIWIENSLIESATLPFGGNWSAEVSPISSSGVSKPVLTVDSIGNAVAVWVRNGYIESSTRKSGIWSSVFIISNSNSDNPHVSISDFGIAVAAWYSLVSGADSILSSTLTLSSNTWGTSLNVLALTPGLKHNYPKIAVDQYGNAVVAWFRYNLIQASVYENVQVLTTALPNGAIAWGALPTLLSGDGIRDPNDLLIKLRFDDQGNALAVWTNSYDGETFTLESAQKLIGKSWLLPATLLQSPTIYSFGMDAAVVDGDVLMTNMAWDGSSSIIIQSQQTNITNPLLLLWTNTNTFSKGSNNGYPQCAMSITGGGTFNSVALWLNRDSSNTVVYASSGSETEIQPPLNVSVSQNVNNFGVYQDYYNTITWNASSDPNLIQYNIYRNGIYFGQTDQFTLKFIDHNQIQNQKVTYAVTALASDFKQSQQAIYILFP